MEVIKPLLYILVFPGFFFQFVFSTYLEWMDRKFYARMQNRRGPLYTGYQGMLQPVADIFKLFFKEDIVPAGADRFMFSLMPILGLAAVVTAGLYIPVWMFTPYNSFEGDLIVVLYLLSIPTLVLFLAGWFSVSPFSLIGATRVLTQLFAYEVPFFLALLTPAVVAGSWQIQKIAVFPWTSGAWWVILVQVLAFGVALLTLQAKLERVPFDIPEAETEVVGGPLDGIQRKEAGHVPDSERYPDAGRLGIYRGPVPGRIPGRDLAGRLQLLIKTSSSSSCSASSARLSPGSA